MLICAQAGCLAGMAQLRRFDAGSNLHDRLEDITALQASVPGLQELNLRGCPVVNCKSYWQATLTKLPNLVVLDGHSIGAVERQQVVAKAGTVTAGLIRSSAFAETGARVWPASVDTVDADAPPGGDDDKWAMVAYLDLSHRLIRRLANLTPLVNLRRANFSDNDVRRCPLRSWYAVECWFGSRVLARLVGSCCIRRLCCYCCRCCHYRCCCPPHPCTRSWLVRDVIALAPAPVDPNRWPATLGTSRGALPRRQPDPEFGGHRVVKEPSKVGRWQEPTDFGPCARR